MDKLLARCTRRGALLILMGVACLAALGCAPNRSLGVRIKNPDGTWRLEPRVVINSRQIERNVALDLINVRDLNGFPQAEVKLRNLSSKTLNFNYRFTWLDEQSFDIPSPRDGWDSGWIEGYSGKSLVGVAPNARARSFRLEIQPKKP